MVSHSPETVLQWRRDEWVLTSTGEVAPAAADSSLKAGAAVVYEQPKFTVAGEVWFRGSGIPRQGDQGEAPTDLKYHLHADNLGFLSLATSLPSTPDSETLWPAQHLQVTETEFAPHPAPGPKPASSASSLLCECLILLIQWLNLDLSLIPPPVHQQLLLEILQNRRQNWTTSHSSRTTILIQTIVFFFFPFFFLLFIVCFPQLEWEL